MRSADPERAERHDGLLTSGGRSRGGILALCWVTPTPARRQHAAVSHEQSAADLRVSGKTYSISALGSLCPGYISSRRTIRSAFEAKFSDLITRGEWRYGPNSLNPDRALRVVRRPEKGAARTYQQKFEVEKCHQLPRSCYIKKVMTDRSYPVPCYTFPPLHLSHTISAQRRS